MSHDEPNRSVFMVVEGIGSFVRALLPVALSDGYSVTYGVWIGVSPEDAKHAYDVWWDPSYVDLTIEGHLANAIEPWGFLSCPVSLAVINPDATPYVVASSDRALEDLLTQELPAGQVLGHLP